MGQKKSVLAESIRHERKDQPQDIHMRDEEN